MLASAECVYLYLESALHIGTGEGGQFVDLPLQREDRNDRPFVPASSLRGSLRARGRRLRGDLEASSIFGPPGGDEQPDAPLVLSDAHLLLFPVRSLRGLFAWTTSPDVLTRHREELSAHGLDASTVPEVPLSEDKIAAVSPGSPLMTPDGMVVLEEISLRSRPQEEVAELAGWLADYALPLGPEYDYWRARLRQSLIILPEPAFHHFVQFRTEVLPRVRIDPTTGTALAGALWTEEYLPAEALLYGLAGSRQRGPDDALAWLKGLRLECLQLGGHRTMAKGLIRLRWWGAKEKTA